ncbi:hypothetical protein D3C85_377560 [compost metagenome]
MVLNGEAEPESLGPPWQADIGLPIYQKACQILDMPKEKRSKEIDRHAPRIAELIRAEMIRLHRLR